VANVEQCPWCERIGCASCHERVRACPVCSVGVCDRCALEDGRCPTCAALVLLDKKDLKRLGLKVGRKAVVLRSENDVRAVLAVREAAWRVEVLAMGTPVEVLPDDRRTTVLDQVAAAPPPPLAPPEPPEVSPLPTAAVEAAQDPEPAPPS
jgi:hypothetical protein